VNASDLDDAGPQFVAEVRCFLAAALTPDLRRAGRDTVGVHSDVPASRIWHRRLYERGWIAPAWPTEYGGAGWSPARRLVFERECAAADAPVLFATGLRTLGPLLIAVGTQWQRRRYLPAILDGRDLWCQGFSEPGAGSDLAALKMRAAREGDHYVVEGSKIWTTGAHHATHMFCLARTAEGAQPQSGITFLLVDMASPGLTVRPIRSIAGEFEFCQVFFDAVRVPIADRVGAENDGWSVAKQLMRIARGNNTTTGVLRRALRRADTIVRTHAEADAGALRQDLASLECRLSAFEALELAILKAPEADRMSDLQASTLKTAATELHQDIAALVFQAAGPAAAAADGTGTSEWLTEGAFAARKYLSTRAASIYSGTSETHRNLMARALLQ
jgi:acyl-CoA dehydrogenase